MLPLILKINCFAMLKEVSNQRLFNKHTNTNKKKTKRKEYNKCIVWGKGEYYVNHYHHHHHHEKILHSHKIGQAPNLDYSPFLENRRNNVIEIELLCSLTTYFQRQTPTIFSVYLFTAISLFSENLFTWTFPREKKSLFYGVERKYTIC